MITFENVTFTYAGEKKPSLSNCSFTIEPGELVLLTGISGCGKTTLLKLINGLLQHSDAGVLEGKVTVNQQEVSDLPLWQIANKVGSVFQNPKSQFFNLDTTSEVLFGLENQGASREEMEQALFTVSDTCGIEPLLDRNIFELSGGEKQRIACASACAVQPQVFVLDEPSSNLDQDGMERLRDILRQLKNSGKTILLAEHRLWYAAELADRVFYFQEGNLKGNYSGRKFRNLSEKELREMGLRSLYQPPIDTNKNMDLNTEGLTVQNLSAAYKGNAVWEQVSFVAPKGKITAITGQNGAGKTTLARCICGLHRQKRGKILWNGTSLNQKECRKHCFLIMQDVNFQLFGESVLAEVMLGNDASEKEAIKVLTGMDLETCTESHPMALSGGQKQRLAIADACLSRKEILIFDEPTSGLDYTHMLQVSRLLQQLANSGLCILVITHDMEFLRESKAQVISLDKLDI